MGSDFLLCICNAEECYCTNYVHVDDYDPRVAQRYPAPEVACDECEKGNHVLEPVYREPKGGL